MKPNTILALLSAACLATGCAASTVAERPDIAPIDAGLSATPEGPGNWPVTSELIAQATIERYWRADRGRLRACVAQFEAYRDAVEYRDALLRGDTPPEGLAEGLE